MTDTYDLTHYLTGSSNISKATLEWQEKLTEARALYDGTEMVLHIAFRLVNEAVARGELWGKCMDCGSPFRYAGLEGQTLEFCSLGCGQSFTSNLL